ncbi:MAG: O-antigen ligase family protein [Myxococcota bacterium]
MLEQIAYPYIALVTLVVAMLFWRPIWGLALLVAIFPMDAWAPRLPVPGINTETIMIGVAFAVTVLRFGGRIPPLRYSGPVFAFIGVMLIAFIVSIPWATGMRAVDGGPAIWYNFKTVKSSTFTALLFFIAYWWVRSPEDRQRTLVAICIAVFLSSVAGIADFVIGINPRVSDGRANGLLDNANAMAETIGPMLFVPLYLLMQGREIGWATRLLSVATYGLGLVALVLSLSRGNWIAFVAANFVFLLLVNRKLLVGAVAVGAILVALGAPLLPTIVRDRLESTTAAGPSVYQVPLAVGLEGSTAMRVVFAKIGLDMLALSPVWGNGLNAFHMRTPEFGARYGLLTHKDPHILLVRLAAEMGTAGILMLAWLSWAVYRCGRTLWRSDSPAYMLGAVVLSASLYNFVSNLASTTFLQVAQVSAQFWILYAIAARATVERFEEQEEPEGVRAPLPGRWRRFARATPVVIRQPATQNRV